MFTATNNNTRLTAFTFAVLMTMIVHGSMLLTFHDAANDATLAQTTQTTQTRNVAVLDTVTIVGRRI
ncbi:hypothetical protein HZ993_17485 [Rhodoferax sp. AJA081-3]|uniref:hypothetical protein n=1 Tax=Rhodoferax sp. AJA081-3 TaxID=2752316 RepID=UPI001ADED812|nr:hypothetical protein [Rhodoferax sp. AJA081-3]QTN27080.1 hypothetical protein HZ993_17485 [Rhodoferax sp. AJA081-3]